jgi:acetyl esterase/lipase
VSVSAKLLRLGLRTLIKRRSRPETVVEEWRRRVDLVSPWIPAIPRRIASTIIAADGVSAHSLAPAAAAPDRHIVYLHGGAYVFGSAMFYRDLTWRIAESACARMLCIDYRLAPEHPFPAALDDVLAAYRWLLAKGAHPRRVTIMGDSAGGGLALAALLRLRDESAPLPAAAVLLSPWTDLALSGASLTANADSEAMFAPESLSVLARHYLAGSDPLDPYASPLYADSTGLPPTLIQAASDELLLDDSVRMAEKLRAAGCEVDLQIWPHMPHAWHLFARLVPEGRQAIERIGAFVRGRT